jgi:2-methylcitrate dehydratase PrpD
MTTTFMQRLCALIAETPASGPEHLPHVRPAFEDTLAVAFAGWNEPVTRKVAAALPGGERLRPGAAIGVDPEAAALIYGTAGHALDYDDVHLVSTTHPSVPIVPALLGAVSRDPGRAGRLASAYAVGLAANVGLGSVLGFAHYERGWHATSTIGPLAAAAAVAHLLGLRAEPAAHALGIAAAQAGGLQRNFGSMAKPLQAGLAAAAGVRAALLAQAGVSADPDVFGEKGYFALYGGRQLAADPEQVTFDPRADGVCVKLYPCCYMAHRPAAAALEAHALLRQGGQRPADLAAVEIVGSQGVFTALRVSDPRTGNEAKFCGPYVVACALTDGAVELRHFEPPALRRADLRALMARVRLVERPHAPDAGGNIDGGPIELVARDASGAVRLRTLRETFPGSPQSPATAEQIEAKVRDCLAHHERAGGRRLTYERFQAWVDGLFARRAAAGKRTVARKPRGQAVRVNAVRGKAVQAKAGRSKATQAVRGKAARGR